MGHDLTIAPSILAADLADLGREVDTVAPAVPMLHIDVMDGHYVPNITFGMGTVAALRARSDLWFDCHLMVDDPATYGPQVLAAGGDSVTFHPPVTPDPAGLIDALHAAGGQAGIAVRPSEPLEDVLPLLEQVDLLLVMTVEPGFGGQSFMPEVLPKIEAAAAWRAEHGATWRLQVDGGISERTIASAAAAGADTFVAGTGVFAADDRPGAAAHLLRLARDEGGSSTT